MSDIPRLLSALASWRGEFKVVFRSRDIVVLHFGHYILRQKFEAVVNWLKSR